MEKVKLTIRDAMLYPNAKIGVYDNIYKMIQDFYFGEDLIYYSRDDCSNALESTLMASQLILRPLSELTEGEIKKCHDVSFWKYEGQKQSELRILIDEKYERWDCSLSKGERDLIDYLRSINIDIDGFIKAGKAVAE